jgi:hypothetical protein
MYEGLLSFLTPLINCIIYLYTFSNYIQESIQTIRYLGLGVDSSLFLYSFFGYILIFLYLFSAHLWGGVGVNKNFNLKHIDKQYILGDSILLVTLGIKKQSVLWYYYFMHYTI